MKGRVLKSTGSWYEVITEEHRLFSCRTKGKLRLDESKEKKTVSPTLIWKSLRLPGRIEGCATTRMGAGLAGGDGAGSGAAGTTGAAAAIATGGFSFEAQAATKMTVRQITDLEIIV